MLPFVLVLALIWGIVFALFLQFVPLGRFLARKRAWIATIIGVGVDLILIFIILPFEHWLIITGIIAASSIGIICRNLANEWHEWSRLMEIGDAPQTDRRQ